MEFLYKYRRLIVIILASTLIGLGVLPMLTDIRIDPKIQSVVEYVALFGALYLLLILPKSYKAKQNKDIEEQVEDQINKEDWSRKDY